MWKQNVQGRGSRIWRGLKRAKSVRLWRNRSIAKRNGKDDWSVCKPLRISSHSSDVDRKFVVASKWKQRVTSHVLYWHRTPTSHRTLSLHDPHWHRTPNGLLPRQRALSNLPSYNWHGTRGSLPCRHTRSSIILSWIDEVPCEILRLHRTAGHFLSYTGIFAPIHLDTLYIKYPWLLFLAILQPSLPVRNRYIRLPITYVHTPIPSPLRVLLLLRTKR